MKGVFLLDTVLVALISTVGIGLFVGAIKLLKLLFKKLADHAAKQEEIEKYGYSSSSRRRD